MNSLLINQLDMIYTKLSQEVIKLVTKQLDHKK